MASQTLSATGLPDSNPYSLPSGWNLINDSLKVVSGAFKCAYSGNGFTCAAVDSPLSSGVIDVNFNILQANNVFGDYSGIFFLTESGNGYFAGSQGNEFYIWNVLSFNIGSSIIHTPIVWSAGDEFRVSFDTANGTINIYHVPSSNVTPAAFANGLTHNPLMTYGFGIARTNADGSGITSVTAQVQSSGSIDSIQTDGVSGLKVGSQFSISTTGLGDLSSVLAETSGIATAKTEAINLVAIGGDGTGDIPFFSDGEYMPFPGLVTVAATDSASSPSTNVPFSIPDDHIDTQFGVVSLHDNTYIGKKLADIGRDILPGDFGYWKNENSLVFHENGKISVDVESGGTVLAILWLQRSASGIMEGYNLTINDAGEITGISSLTQKGLTSAGLTSKGLTRSSL